MSSHPPLLSARDLTVSFRSRGRRSKSVPVVDGLDLEVFKGETLGLVGESGSGKSTTARALLGLIPKDRGEILWDGEDLDLRGNGRRRMQMVFQDPYSSLDPSMPVNRIIGEPLEVHDKLRGEDRDARVRELLELVGLSSAFLRRYPYEFSGGQRQRIAIARAIALEPEVVLCDEPVSALDVSTQNQIINLLKKLRDEVGVSYLFIAHDLAVVRNISQRVMVMYLGRAMETRSARQIFSAPAHPYTEALMAAVPLPKPSLRGTRRHDMVRGELPDAGSVPSGCVFHPRCRYAMDICREEVPERTPLAGGGEVACHLQTSGPALAGAPLSALTTAAGGPTSG